MPLLVQRSPQVCVAGSPTHPFPFKALQALHLPRDGGLLADVGERRWMQPAMMHAQLHQPLAYKRITRAPHSCACVMPYRMAPRCSRRRVPHHEHAFRSDRSNLSDLCQLAIASCVEFLLDFISYSASRVGALHLRLLARTRAGSPRFPIPWANCWRSWLRHTSRTLWPGIRCSRTRRLWTRRPWALRPWSPCSWS